LALSNLKHLFDLIDTGFHGIFGLIVFGLSFGG
jgi:hypothetical protein